MSGQKTSQNPAENLEIDLSVLTQRLNEHFGDLREQEISDIMKIKNLSPVITDLLLVQDLHWKMNDGGMAQVFSYTSCFEDLDYYGQALARVAPSHATCFTRSLDYLKSLELPEIIRFYELDRSYGQVKQEDFYVRDKINYLSKDIWRMEKNLESYLEDYVAKNAQVIVDFCQEQGLKYQKDPQKEMEDELLMESWMADWEEFSKDSEFDKLFSQKEENIFPQKEEKGMFEMQKSRLIWHVADTELAALTELRISLEDRIEVIEIDFSPLKNLESLQISGKNLKSFPSGFGILKKLTKIRLILSEVENVDNLKEDFLSLPNLESLEISNNQLRQFPEFLCELKSLKKLDLSVNNHLKFIPKNIQNLSNLQELNLWYNKITVLPEELAALQSLICLNLGRNELREIPDFLYSLNNLQDLNLGGNFINQISPKIKNLKNLEKLYLLDNYLSDLPLEIMSLKNLTFANVLHDNDLRDLNSEIKQFLKNPKQFPK